MPREADTEARQAKVEAATSTVLSLVGLSALRKRAITKGEPTRGDQLQALCEPMLEAARSGELSLSAANHLLSGTIVREAELEEVRALASKKKLPSILRFLFTSKVSWAVFTIEWIDGLAAFLTSLGLHGKRVLEVCAGENTLSAPMRARGFDWVATDVTLRETAVSQPLELAAFDAVKKLEPSAVFWSWWSEGAAPLAAAATAASSDPTAGASSTPSAAEPPSPPHGEDRLVTEHCLERGLPLIFVGEGRGGVTGSASFWAGPWRPELVSDLLPGFADVPCWDGAYDRTWCLRPGSETLPHTLPEAAAAAAPAAAAASSKRLGTSAPPPSPASHATTTATAIEVS